MRKCFVVEHQNPDTDSIVSAIVYSEYLKKNGIKAEPRRAGELNKETKFLFSFLKERPPRIIKNLSSKNVVLVDHGELGQAVFGAEKANILRILDHHRMGGLTTIEPIYYRAEPLGSTSTIIAKIFAEENLNLTKRQAHLLLFGIISDTLKLTAPTTTKEDKEIAKKLNKICQIDIDQIAKKMFEAKSDLKGIPIKEILTKDYKEYNFSGKKVGIGVCETIMPEPFEKIKERVFKELKKLKQKRKLNLLFFAVVDILKKESLMYLIDFKEKEIAQKAFKRKIQKDNIMVLKGIISRKTQMALPLARVLKLKYE